MIGSKGVKVSGGQRQRIAAARMFIRQPELLVLDDLSSALDVETERTRGRTWRNTGARPGPPAWWFRTAAPRCAEPTASWC